MWVRIPDFPGYSVSDQGQVRNDHTGRLLVLTQNQHGVCQVGMMHEGVQYKRSVARLVAEAHLEPSHLEAFDTPINLDGNRMNNHIINLMWRPRWFAIKYHRQFSFFVSLGPSIRERIQEIHTGIHYPDSWEAATRHGLLDKEILIATLNRTYVWPTYQEFRIVG